MKKYKSFYRLVLGKIVFLNLGKGFGTIFSTWYHLCEKLFMEIRLDGSYKHYDSDHSWVIE